MQRTWDRPIVTGRVSIKETLVFSILLCVISLTLLVAFVNNLTAALTFISMIGYAGVYTFYLKHRTPQNIVIGGLAGAAPPLLGSVAVTGHVDSLGLMLLLIIFVWTPPHFWALAIHRFDEYARAKVPMLPNIHGVVYTKKCMLAYTALLVFFSYLPYIFHYAHMVFLLGVSLINGWFLFSVIQLYRDKSHQSAKRVFIHSIVYLCILYSLLLVDHLLLIFVSW